MNTHRTSKRAFTLVEMLVVIAIVTIITAITIPAAIRSGLFDSRKTAIAGRELFETLRAAKIYAATNNVETAVVYAGTTVVDSENGNVVPVIDAVAIVRRMSRAELDDAEIVDPPFPVFEPIRASQGINFAVLRDNNCLLADLFEVDGTTTDARSVTGLSTILIWEGPLDTDFYAPRFPYNVANLAAIPETFPAHRFLPSGALEPEPPTQRTLIRVGLLPDRDVDDRYPQDPTAIIPADVETIDIWFNTVDPVTADFIHHPDRGDVFIFPDREGSNAFDMPLEIDIELFIYTATGRVKVSS